MVEFERYTEQARLALFFARFATSKLGGERIEAEHLLDGVLRAATGRTRHVIARSGISIDSMRQRLAAAAVNGAQVSTSAEIPFSDATKRILHAAAAEAELLGHRHIGTEHLLLGILGEPDTRAAQILLAEHFDLDTLRAEVAGLEQGQGPEG